MAKPFEEAIRIAFQTEGEKDVRKLEDAVRAFGDATEEVKVEAAGLADEISRATDSRKQIEGYKQLEDRLVRTAAEAKELRAEVDRLGEAFLANENPTKRQTAEYQRKVDALSKLEAKQGEYAAELQRSAGTLKAAGIDTARLASEELRLSQTSEQARAKLLVLAGSTREAARAARDNADAANDSATATGNAARAQDGLIDRLGKAKLALAGAATGLYAATRTLSAAASAASDFQTSIAAISTIAPQADLEALSGSVRELAKQYGGDAAAQAKALYEIIAAGVEDTAAAMQVLDTANKLSIGGLADVQTSAAGLVATLNAYGLAATEASRVSDAFFVSAAAGNTTIEELATNIGNVAPLASSVGVSIEELAAAVGALTAGGLSTSQAMTQIQSTLAAVVKPTSEAAKAADKLGIDFTTAGIRAQGFSTWLQNVAKAANGNEVVLGQLFGRLEGLQGVLALTGNSADGFAKALGDMQTGAGRTDEAFGKMSETAAFAAARYQAAMKDLQLTLGNVVTSLSPVIEGLTGLLNGFNSLPEPVRNTAAAAASLMAILIPLRAATKVLGGVFKDLGAAIPTVGSAAEGASTSVGKLNNAAKGLAATLAAGFAVDSVIEAYQAISDLNDINRQLTDNERELLDARDRQRLQIEQLKRAFGEYADVQRRSADEMARMSETDLTAYSTQLNAAASYWRAIEVEARRAGDQQRQAFAKEQAQAYGAELDVVRQKLAAISAPSTVDLEKYRTELLAVSGSAKDLTEHLDTAFKDRDFATTSAELGAMAVAMAELASETSEAEATITNGLGKSLKSLSGQDLLAFQTAAVRAFEQSGTASTSAGIVLRETLGTALEKLGLSAQAAGRTITQEGGNIIAAFRVVADNANATSEQIELAFRAALSRIGTSEEAKQLGASLREAAAQGKIGFEEAERAASALRRRMEEIQQAANPLADSFAQLGIKSQAELRRAADAARDAYQAIVEGARNGEAAQEDVRRAFEAYAEAARAAAADSTEASQRQVETQLQAMAAAAGLRDVFKETGEAGKEAGEKTADGFGKAQAAVNATKAAAGGVTSTLAQTAGAAQTAAAGIGQVASSVTVLNEEQNKAMNLLNAFAKTGQDLTRIGVANARYILDNVGGMIGSTAQVLQQVIANFEARTAQAMAVTQQAMDMTRQLEDTLANLSGDQTAIEQRRHDTQLERIALLEKEARAAGEYDALRYARLRELAEKEHRIRMQQIEEQKRAEREDFSGSRGSGGRSGSGGGAGLDGGTKTLNVNINGKNLKGVDLDDFNVRRQLAGIVIEELQQQSRTSSRY